MRALLTLLALSAAIVGPALAQGRDAPEHRVVLELGAVAQRPLTGGPTSWGGSVAAELSPAGRGWEVEVGFAALGRAGDHESSLDVLVMKPWQAARTVELMVGMGPEVSWHDRGVSLSAEVVAHVMWWLRRHVGLFVEPGVSIQPSRHGERSVGVAAGVLLGLP